MKIYDENVKEIYSALGDAESRDIFENRLWYSLTDDDKFLEKIITAYVVPTGINDKGVISYLLYGLDKYDYKLPIVIYGCGEMGGKIYDEIGDKISCLCDKSVERQRKGFHGKKVISQHSLIEQKENFRVIIGSIDFYLDIYQYLKENGVELAYDNLDIITQWKQITDEQYFDRDIIQFGEDEIFVDGGCLDFATVKQLLKECSTVKKVFAFEPDKASACKCRKEAQVTNFKNYVIIEKGLYSENAELHFNTMGNGCSSIAEGGDDIISVCALDEEITEPITFIKMDIEGAELEALKGAVETIKKYHPKLAICIYHKKEDIVKIPGFILRLNRDYKLYIRHYSDNAGETVLYAI